MPDLMTESLVVRRLGLAARIRRLVGGPTPPPRRAWVGLVLGGVAVALLGACAPSESPTDATRSTTPRAAPALPEDGAQAETRRQEADPPLTAPSTPPTPRPPKIEVAPEVLASYAGHYIWPSRPLYTVIFENGQLAREIDGGPRVELFRVSETKFYHHDVQVTFNLDEAGEVESLTVDQPARPQLLFRKVGAQAETRRQETDPPVTEPFRTPGSRNAREYEFLPPADSPPIIRRLVFRIPTRGGQSLRERRTYFLQLETLGQRRVSNASSRHWVPYSEAEPLILEDAERFWRSGQFESLWVDVLDASFTNGVAGRIAFFNLVERADIVIPAAGYPTPPPEYRQPPAGHERIYPPPEG